MEKTLIVVDDNTEFARLVCEIAARRGWNSQFFATGREFMEATHLVQLPTLVLLDLLMPDMDGIETISELSRSDPAMLRIRFMTGGDPTNAAAANLIASTLSFNLGRTLYKPLSVQELDTVLFEEEGNLLKLEAPPASKN